MQKKILKTLKDAVLIFLVKSGDQILVNNLSSSVLTTI